jgi:hypothetical protein
MSFDALFKFEQDLAEYTGAPYVVATDGCTHAIELCMRLDNVQSTAFTAYTYLSIPMLMHQLRINYILTTEEWHGEYQFHGTRIWDSARRLEPNMYRPGQLQCLSFGNTKPLELGKGGAILVNNEEEYEILSRWRADGRNLREPKWGTPGTQYFVGWHYCPTLELCEQGSKLLPSITPVSQKAVYPDCRNILITS